MLKASYCAILNNTHLCYIVNCCIK